MVLIFFFLLFCYSRQRRKIIQVPNTDTRKTFIKTQIFNIPGKTHALNQKNNEMCNTINS